MAESSEGEEEGKLTGGNQQLMVDDDLRDGKEGSLERQLVQARKRCGFPPRRQSRYLLAVSTSHSFLLVLFHGNWSDGAQPHLVNIQFQKKVKLQLVVIYVDFKLDESYT
ncbi:UNVERIFIED_CONTAM: Anaphase-promoting complex subunit [Sesamum calycinum]|uniref:Anaphase-promoting complex subunit n=1 Tax=Sesamum calycinum TaxID=2727403 RepID=A0AAW2STT0_9LAMI